MSNRTSKIWDVPVERFKEIIKNSRSYNNAAANLGFSHGGNNKTVKKRIQELNINVDHFKGKSWSKGTKQKNPFVKYTLDAPEM